MAQPYNTNSLRFLANKFIHDTLKMRDTYCHHIFSNIMGRAQKYECMGEAEKDEILYKFLSETTDDDPKKTALVKRNIDSLLNFLDINNGITSEIMLFMVASSCNHNLRSTISYDSYASYPSRFFSGLLNISTEKSKVNFNKLVSMGLIVSDLALVERDRLMSPIILDAILGPELTV